MISNRRLYTIIGLAFLFIYFFILTPNSTTPALVKSSCRVRKNFGNLTDSHYFIFIKAKHGDDDVLSNMFYFLGLKYGKTFAMNIERPMNWYGLSEHRLDDSYLQQTEIKPKVLAQEMDYNPESLANVLGSTFTISPKVVVGFLRDPYDVFMSCLLKYTQIRRRKGYDVGMMLDKNVNDYLNAAEMKGNYRLGQRFVGSDSCNNQLSYSLGLSNEMYTHGYNPQVGSEAAAERFADLVEKRVNHFLIYEKLAKSMYLLIETYCLYPNQDFHYLSRLPESYVGIGLGYVQMETKKRLENFLQFDYAIYNRINQKFDKDFAQRIKKTPGFLEGFQVFRESQEGFNSHCCRNTLSMEQEDIKRRAYGLTEEGAKDMQCSLISGSNMLFSNMLFQIQEFKLTQTVSSLIKRQAEYKEFLELVSSTLGEEEENAGADSVGDKRTAI